MDEGCESVPDAVRQLTSRFNGPELALLAPAAERERRFFPKCSPARSGPQPSLTCGESSEKIHFIR